MAKKPIFCQFLGGLHLEIVQECLGRTEDREEEDEGFGKCADTQAGFHPDTKIIDCDIGAPVAQLDRVEDFES